MFAIQYLAVAYKRMKNDDTKKMTVLRTILFSTVALLSTITTCGQVTIGSSTKPAEGALLHLQEESNGNSSKGLLLPRVKITNRNTLEDIDTDLEGKLLTGLMVYNVNTDDARGICPDVYIWLGEYWQSMSTKNDKTKYDETTKRLTDHEGNEYYTNSFDEAGIWMSENLRTRTSPGCENELQKITTNVNVNKGNVRDIATVYAIPPQFVADSIAAVAGGTTVDTRDYGLVYNWHTAIGWTTAEWTSVDQGNIDHPTVQGICPRGWHVPSDYEINLLEKAMYTGFLKYSTVTSVAAPWEDAFATTLANRGTHKGIMLAPQYSWGRSRLPTDGGFHWMESGNIDVRDGLRKRNNLSRPNPGYMLTSSINATGSDVYYRTGETELSDGNPYNWGIVYRNTADINWMLAIRCKKDS